MTSPVLQAALLKEVMQQISRNLPAGQQVDPFHVGQILPARIVSDSAGEPMLLLAGVRLPATIPGNLKDGQALRLQVMESSPTKLLLQIVPDAARAAAEPDAMPPQAPAQVPSTTMPAPTASIPMPGGAQATLWLDPDLDRAAEEYIARGERSRSMLVRYESPVLGRTDVLLRLTSDQLDATVLATGGDPLALVRATSGELRRKLAGAAERPVAISTGGRFTEDVDVRA